MECGQGREVTLPAAWPPFQSLTFTEAYIVAICLFSQAEGAGDNSSGWTPAIPHRNCVTLVKWSKLSVCPQDVRSASDLQAQPASFYRAEDETLRGDVPCTRPHSLLVAQAAPDPPAEDSQSSALSCQPKCFHCNEHPHLSRLQEQGPASVPDGRRREVSRGGA